MTEYARDPDDLHGDSIVCSIEIAVRRNGSMSVRGYIDDEAYALAMLDSARDAIKRHNARKRINLGESVIVPSADVGLVR